MSKVNNKRGGDRITAEKWQVLSGIIGAPSGGTIHKKKSKFPCSDCGFALWAHDKERVRYDNGTYGYRFLCP